jgi:hypothetical protein
MPEPPNRITFSGELRVRSPGANFLVSFHEGIIAVVFDRLRDLVRAGLDARRLRKILGKRLGPASRVAGPEWGSEAPAIKVCLRHRVLGLITVERGRIRFRPRFRKER